jgi:hypothetical protein
LSMRFRLTRLVLIVALLALMLGYWRVAVHDPDLAEQHVWLTESRVTAAGVERFHRAHPNVQINRQRTIIDGPQPIRLEIRCNGVGVQ